MKITLPQLKPYLAKKLAPVYIVSGEELFLKQEALDLIREAAKKAAHHERIRLLLDSHLDSNELYTLLFSHSLMAEKRLIELDCRTSLPTKIFSDILQDYATHPSIDNILIIDINKLDDKVSKSAWYKAFEKISIAITIWPIPPEQLPQWLITRAKQYELTLAPDAATLLAEYVEGNLTAAAQAIEKISLDKERIITKQAIEAILTDESQFTIFDFMAALGNPPRALHILDHLKSEGIEPTLILWGITRELRQLMDLATGLKQGMTCDALFHQYRIFAKRQSAIRALLNRFSLDDLRKLLLQTAQLDRVIKGAVSGNIWDNLSMFCLRLAP